MKLLDPVRPGDRLGRLLDLHGKAIAEFRAFLTNLTSSKDEGGKNKIVAQLGPEDLAQMLTQTGIPTTHRTLPELEVIPMTRASMATPMQFAKFFVHFQDSGTVKFCTGDYGGRPALDKYLNSKLPSPQLYLDTRCFTSDDSRMMNGVFSFSQSMRMGQYLADSLLIVAPDNSGVTHYGHHTDPAYAGPNNISLWKEMTK